MGACEFLSKDYRAFDASELPDGTVVDMFVWAFFKLDNLFHTNEGLAAILRGYRGSIRVVGACDLH